MSSEAEVVLTAVERREARVISRLPFRPSRAGTRMNISLMLLYTSQCWQSERDRETYGRRHCSHAQTNLDGIK